MFNHLAQCFPNAKITNATITSWMMELKDYQPQQVYTAVKSYALKSGSDFLPSVFQVLRELKIQHEETTDYNLDWLKVESMACGRSKYQIAELCTEAKYALQCLGGLNVLGRSAQDEMKWIKKDFLKLCEQAKEFNLQPRDQLETGFKKILEAKKLTLPSKIFDA